MSPTHYRWTPELDYALVKLRERGESTEEISEKLNVRLPDVEARLTRLRARRLLPERR